MSEYDGVNVCSKIPSALISSATTEKDKVCVSQSPWGTVQLIFQTCTLQKSMNLQCRRQMLQTALKVCLGIHANFLQVPERYTMAE